MGAASSGPMATLPTKNSTVLLPTALVVHTDHPLPRKLQSQNWSLSREPWFPYGSLQPPANMKHEPPPKYQCSSDPSPSLANLIKPIQWCQFVYEIHQFIAVQRNSKQFLADKVPWLIVTKLIMINVLLVNHGILFTIII